MRFLYFLSRNDSAGTYKYCTLEHVDVHDRGGLVSGNTDYKRVADFKTKECGNLHMSDSPDPKKSMTSMRDLWRSAGTIR